MIYLAKKGQTSYGEDIGILLLDTFCPFIPGDVGNASSYDYPVRFKKVAGLSVEKILSLDKSYLPAVINSAKELEQEGVQAITSDCGFMAIFQNELKKHLRVPVFLSSLLQIPMITSLIKSDAKLGIITADSQALIDQVFAKIGLKKADNLIIRGLENSSAFVRTVMQESGFLDEVAIKKEVVQVAKRLQTDERKLGAILLECSMLPPYGLAVQQETNLPVFDFLTMVNYVHSSLSKKNFGEQ